MFPLPCKHISCLSCTAGVHVILNMNNTAAKFQFNDTNDEINPESYSIDNVQAVDLESYIAHNDEADSLALQGDSESSPEIIMGHGPHNGSPSQIQDWDEADILDPNTLERPSAPLFGEGRSENWIDTVDCVMEGECAITQDDFPQGSLWLDDVPVIDDENFLDIIHASSNTPIIGCSPCKDGHNGACTFYRVYSLTDYVCSSM
jgi:hypothetical protein